MIQEHMESIHSMVQLVYMHCINSNIGREFVLDTANISPDKNSSAIILPSQPGANTSTQCDIITSVRGICHEA